MPLSAVDPPEPAPRARAGAGGARRVSAPYSVLCGCSGDGEKLHRIFNSSHSRSVQDLYTLCLLIFLASSFL